ncbi:hypothetical protein HZA44_01060 [Candidatus Peregrinibacteria bacterium]|nr:hypothetical protein [Candidatus Peregrinibacteria bacterium]
MKNSSHTEVATRSDTQAPDSHGAFRSERVIERPGFVGNLYRIEDKLYALTEHEDVIDVETGDLVFDSKIYDRVFDLYGEDLRIAAEIRRKAKAIARGNTAMEEALRLHFAFTGLPQDADAPQAQETQVA